MALDRADIKTLLKLLNKELRRQEITGELYLVGGAVMCLVFNARQSTQDLDAFFRPVDAVRAATTTLAAREGYPEDWLNDAVKGYLSNKGEYRSFLELSNLRVMVASPEYLLAMKCLAMRLGAEFHDEADVRFLLRYLNVTSYTVAIEIVVRYYPIERIPQKTLYALQEILEEG
ncbi:MAG: DUF6036 family nucleotidyltransferase [Proteobacteria bacterium]|nr:DUF6036 family nucleotidyltransferase [Pseudomonadota bacterium]